MATIRLQVTDGDRTRGVETVRALSALGYACIETGLGRPSIRALQHEQPDVVVARLNLHSAEGLEFLRRASRLPTRIPIFVIPEAGTETDIKSRTEVGTILSASTTIDALDAVVREAVNGLATDDDSRLTVDTLIGDSAEMAFLRKQVAQFARAGRSTILILGETGTGKELVANQIHRLSGQSGTFVALNCALSDGPLMENSLFGHERGAFTDAKTREIGVLEHADRGTLFLDEIGEMPLAVQAKFLRFLETGIFQRLGGHEDVSVDVRVVAATHRDLAAMVRAEQFREDLFFRLNVLRLEVPPLRARGGDVLQLAEYFLKLSADKLSLPLPPLSEEARSQLVSHDWPGNVRELKNMMERVALLQGGLTIDVEDLPPEVIAQAREALAPSMDIEAQVDSPVVPYAEARQKFEVEYFRRLLEEHAGNVASVARASGVDPSNVRRILKRHSLDPKVFRP